jgi:DegV family protein with EDD domain
MRNNGIAKTGRQHAGMDGIESPGSLGMAAARVVIEAALIGEEENRHRGEPIAAPATRSVAAGAIRVGAAGPSEEEFAMSTIRIVTDSTCDLEQALIDEQGITVVPLIVTFGDTPLVDGTDLTPQDFYSRMAAAEELPTTAAPSPGGFEEAFRALAADGATGVVCVNVSYELSATGQSARVAAGAVADVVDVRCVDSRSLTSGLGSIVLEAARSAAAGAGLDEIEALCEDLAERTRMFGAIDTMENLRKGGRVGGAKAMVGTMLSIKPIVDVSSGRVEEAARTRTRRRSFAWLRDRILADEPVTHLCVGQGDAADFDDFLALLGDAIDIDRVRTGWIGPVIGTHAGQGVIGVTYIVAGDD